MPWMCCVMKRWRRELAKDVSDSLCLRWGMLVRVKTWCCACHGDSSGVGSTPYAEKNTKDKRHDVTEHTHIHTHTHTHKHANIENTHMHKHIVNEYG